jgi:glutamine synthetase
MNKFIIEYVWIGGNSELRSKTRVIKRDIINTINDIPEWNYDGSSTNQAEGHDSEVIIRPVALYNHYNNSDRHRIVLCDTWLPNGEKHSTNTRKQALDTLEKDSHNKPLFGIEQEFFILDENRKPIGFNKDIPQGQFYCSVGHGNSVGKKFLDLALERCLDAGVEVTGSNLEVCAGQMEIQVCNYGIRAGDDNLMLKYILERTGEEFGYIVSYDAKPVLGDWNGSGCHTNFSTESMRNQEGYKVILDCMSKLELKHQEHIDLYGSDNHLRLTGEFETSDIKTFSYGVANRGASIRIPRDTEKNRCGYFEDRRPSSSADMYLVTAKIYETCCL